MIYLELFLGFLKVGMFTFGGGYAAVPLIRDVVLSRGWLGEDMLTYMIAVSESTPGPIMVNMATYTGSLQAGAPGALVATFAVVLPSFVIILLISVLLKNLIKNRYAQAAMGGMKPCVTGIILATGVFMILRNCVGTLSGLRVDPTAVVMTAALALVYFGSRKFLKNGISPVALTGLAAAAGVIVYGVK